MARKGKSKTGDILLIVVGIALIVAVFAAAVYFAPDDPFSETQFIKDVGESHRY